MSPDAALTQGAEIALRYLQGRSMLATGIDPESTAEIAVGEYEQQLRGRL